MRLDDDDHAIFFRYVLKARGDGGDDGDEAAEGQEYEGRDAEDTGDGTGEMGERASGGRQDADEDEVTTSET